MIELKNINKKYSINKKANISVEALKDISLIFPYKGIVSILGRSGSGKTTLLNIIGGIDCPTAGEVLYNGDKIDNYSMTESDNYRNHTISFIFQNYNLLNEYNVINNIKIGLRLQEKDEALIHTKAMNALMEVGLEGYETRKINTLSGGEQQRVVIARALAKDSKVLLCDEPTGNLDSKTADDILLLFQRISRERLVILITHDEEIAKKNSDRIIYLKDGIVEKDQIINIQNEIEENKINFNKNYYGFKLKDAFIMIKDNISHSLIFSVFVLLLMISAFALMNVFGSLTKYNSQNAYLYTLETNNQYVIQITKYIDRPIIVPVNGIDVLKHGPQIYYEGVQEEDITELSLIVNHQANFYPSYFFNKNFHDFTDTEIVTNQTTFPYEALSFREAIAVNDFNQFHMKILYGSLPRDNNDVLLYDYMVYSLIQRGVLSGSIEDNVNVILTDKQTNLEIRIVGIIKSDYELYSYIKDNADSYYFEETYLTSLQSIFCRPEFIDTLNNERNMTSVLKTTIAHNLGDTLEILDSNIKKIKYTESLTYDFLSVIDLYETVSGIILTKSEVAEILNINVGSLTVNMMDEFLDSYSIICNKSLYDWSIERSYIFTEAYQVIGIIDDVIKENQTYLYYEANEENTILMNADFRQIYISLGLDWDVNKKVMNNFVYTPYSNEFYIENPEFYEEGYVDYNSYGILINDSSTYLDDVKIFAQDILLPLLITSFIGLIFFAFFTIKKYDYKIGIMKALGTRNKDISLIFGLQIVFLGILAYLLSIPLSYLLMNRVNYDFVKAIHSGLVFFKMDLGFMLLSASISLLLIIISISIPLLMFIKNTPVEIIRNTQRRKY